MPKSKKIKFGIPSGTLKEPVAEWFNLSGYNLKINGALSTVQIDDPEIECFLARAKEIAPLIDKGILDAGVVSRAVVAETKANIKEVIEIGTNNPAWERTILVLAVPKNSSIRSVKGLKGKKIITRLPALTEQFLKENKVSAIVEQSDGTNESRVPALADAVVEYSNTGATLEYFKLRILTVLMENPVIIAANPDSLKNKWKKEKIDNLALLLKGARKGLEMAGIMLHASNDMMEAVLKVLPSLKRPTVTHLRGENWFDVFSIVKKKDVRDLIPKLKKIGCTDIIEFPLRKIVP